MSEKKAAEGFQTGQWADQKRYRQYVEFREFLDEYKVSRGCITCGYNTHPAALDLDHRDPKEKTVILSSMYSYTKERQLAELAKCDVMCANCHRIKSFESGQFSPFYRQYLVTIDEQTADPTLFDAINMAASVEGCG